MLRDSLNIHRRSRLMQRGKSGLAIAVVKLVKRWRHLGLQTLAVGLLAIGMTGSPAPAPGQSAGQLPLVAVIEAELEDVSRRYRFLGRVQAIETVALRARVEGFLQERRFEEGKDVEAGQILFLIEPEPYEAALGEAQAALNRASAARREAQLDLNRRLTLLERGNVSQASVDEAERDRDTAAADVAAASARVQRAELDLSYTRIVSPISGRVGRASTTVGNLVGPESEPLARVVQLNPIRVVYSVADRDRLEAWAALNPDSLESFEESFIPQIRLPDGNLYPHAGRLEFTDNQVDPDTGTIAVWAIFPNPDGLLMPGHLVTVESRVEAPRRLPVVPQASVQRDRDGQFVLIVNGDDIVEERRISIGEPFGQGVSVIEGLQGGERIVVRGLQRVEPGIAVEVSMHDSGGRGS